jgi:hypothetical protein
MAKGIRIQFFAQIPLKIQGFCRDSVPEWNRKHLIPGNYLSLFAGLQRKGSLNLYGDIWLLGGRLCVPDVAKVLLDFLPVGSAKRSEDI